MVARSAEWLAANPDRKKASEDAWRALNAERVKAANAAWLAANPGRKKASVGAWRAANAERVKAATSAWKKAHPKVGRACSAAWKKANPERVKAQKHNRRARKRNAEGSHTPEDIKRLLHLQKGTCVVCRVDLALGYHVDHIVPLALEGRNDRHNLQLLCPTCNLQKGAKHPIDFMQQKGFLL